MKTNWGIYLHIAADSGVFVYDGFSSSEEAHDFLVKELNNDANMSVKPCLTKQQIAHNQALKESAVTLDLDDLKVYASSEYPKAEWENLLAEAQSAYEIAYESILKELGDGS